jgi:hypothetical protein
MSVVQAPLNSQALLWAYVHLFRYMAILSLVCTAEQSKLYGYGAKERDVRHFATENGRAGYEKYRHDFAKLICAARFAQVELR